MGLNDLVLTGNLLAELYPQSLVHTGDVPATPASPDPVLTKPAAAAAPGASSTLSAAGSAAASNVQAVASAAASIGSPEVSAASSPAAATASAASTGDNSPWKFLGNNKKQVLIVVDYPGAAYLPDEELAFLTKMLTACKLGLDDVAIVNSAHYPQFSSADYLRQFRSLQVLLFGRDPELFGLPLSFPQFQVQSFAGVTFLSAPALGEMMGNTALKGTLWT
ncbi:MAG: hypothetical protein EOO05_21525, partial [Chitinophagaceae bacterium]